MAMASWMGRFDVLRQLARAHWDDAEADDLGARLTELVNSLLPPSRRSHVHCSHGRTIGITYHYNTRRHGAYETMRMARRIARRQMLSPLWCSFRLSIRRSSSAAHSTVVAHYILC